MLIAGFRTKRVFGFESVDHILLYGEKIFRWASNNNCICTTTIPTHKNNNFQFKWNIRSVFCCRTFDRFTLFNWYWFKWKCLCLSFSLCVYMLIQQSHNCKHKEGTLSVYMVLFISKVSLQWMRKKSTILSKHSLNVFSSEKQTKLGGN